MTNLEFKMQLEKRKPDISLAKELLGWEPKVPLAEGLAKTIAYFRAKA